MLGPHDSRSPLRVLHVVPSFYPALGYGGPIHALYELCLAQVAAGRSVRVLTSDANGPSRLRELSGRWVSELGVPTFYAPVRLGEDLAPALLTQLWRELPSADLVHVSGLWSGTSLLGLLGATLTGKPTVLTPHGSLMPWALAAGAGRRRKLTVLRTLWPLFTRLGGWHVSSSQEEAGLRQLMQHGHLPSHTPIVQIENGLRPHAAMTMPAPKPDPISPRPPQLVVLGRIVPIKRIELAVSALHALRKTLPTARLTIAGPVPPSEQAYFDTLRVQIDQLGLSAAIDFPGLVGPDHKAKLLAEATALWLTSHMESFGIVVLEALAAGTPVIAVSSTPWQLLDAQRVGHFVEATPEAIASATLRLCQLSDAEQAELSVRCQQLVADRYTWPVLETKLFAFYQAIRSRK